VDESGRACASPVCPIFAGEGIYLLVVKTTPKNSHLRENNSYTLHAQVGADDLEFQISGVAREVIRETEREMVIKSIPFSSFNDSDPIFELLISHALTVSWSESDGMMKTSFTERNLF
jgi:hypothetical protein